jgi:hypothetical protein
MQSVINVIDVYQNESIPNNKQQQQTAMKLSSTLLSKQSTQLYKTVELLETIRIIKSAPTCFGSCRNHHQGATVSV